MFSDILYLLGHPRKLNVCALDMDAQFSCMKNRVTKTPCTNQGGLDRAVKDAMKISRLIAPPQGAGINKDTTIKRDGGGEAY